MRGVAGEPPLTPEFVLRLGQAAGSYFKAHTPRPVVLLGKDTRESGDLLEAALAAGLLSQGVRVEHLGVLPTPGVAYLTQHLGATAGVVLSASHNPYQDNGIKFFSARGEKLPDAAELEIEDLLQRELKTAGIGIVSDFHEAERIYLDFLTAKGPRLDGLKIALDTANGATYRLAPRLFQRLGAEVFALFNTPDGRNINRGCGSTHPETLQRMVVEMGCDLGVAFDGDGDRAILVDRQGRLFHGDHLLYLNALVRKERGEQSGHVLFLDHATTGDGMLTAILTLSALQQSGRDLAEWQEALPMYPQLLKNVRVRDKQALIKHPRLLEAVSQAEARLEGRGRVNVRPSGTEPLVRVMVEGPEELVRPVCDGLVSLVERLDAAGG